MSFIKNLCSNWP